LSKKFSGETFQNCCWRGGEWLRKLFLLDSIFPTKLTEFPTKLTEFPTKLTEFVPFIFVISQYCPTVKRILPDCLCLHNKLAGGRLPPLPPARYAHGRRFRRTSKFISTLHFL
jgi:hypothetical protein